MFESFIGINIWTALFVLLNTLLVFFVAKKFLFVPVKNMIDSRQKEIDAMYAEADAAKNQAQSMQEEYRQKLGTKCPTVEQNVGNLSGGNQQKVLLAKWMFTDPDVLILDEPTRGIDVGAKYEIYCIINDLVSQGKSVVMISSELPELLGMSDRIYVMNEGRLIAELDAKDASQEIIMSHIMQDSKGGIGA